MLKNYLKIAVRNLLRHKGYAAVNLGGLAVGLACTLFILLWVRDELSFDRFHSDVERIYRLNWDFKYDNNEGVGSGTPPPLAAALAREIPGIAATTRLHPIPTMVVRYKDKFVNESRIVAADTNFLELFDFKMVSGSTTALMAPNSVVLTEETARKYFGDESPLGKMITIGEVIQDLYGTYQNVFQVTGVLQNPPHNSHIQFDMLISMSSYPQVAWRDWSWVWMQMVTYAKLDKKASVPAVASKVPDMLKKYIPAKGKRGGFSYDDIIKNGGRWNFVFQPLTDVYLGSTNIGNRVGPIGNRTYVYIFATIACFILLIACINFMNLTTAQSATRAKEIGVRKALGSEKRLLVAQFLIESAVFSSLAMPVAVFMVELCIDLFNQLSGKALELALFDPWWLPAVLALLTLFVGLIAGSYPSFYLSAFSPLRVFRGAAHSGGRRQRLRDALVVFQFAMTIGLIACTLLVERQLDFVRSADLGFSKDGVIAISNESNRQGNDAEAFKQRLKGNSGIINAAVSTGVPPDWGFQDSYKAEGKGDEQFDLISYKADEDFVETLGIEIIQGRGFSKEFAANADGVILNEAAVKYLGWENPIGKTIDYPGGGNARYRVIGVMRDFNFMTLRSPIVPFALFHISSKSYQISRSVIVVRISQLNIASTIRLLELEWKTFAPGIPFEFQFLDESLDAEYRAEQRFGKVFLVFSCLTIFIACIGLLGLVSYSTEQRTKEIGVRKVLGASVAGIVALLSREFVKLVLLANIIAWPIAYFVMNDWLRDFAYRIDIGWWIFPLAGGLALLIALLTVSAQAIRAALANPVEALRYE